MILWNCQVKLKTSWRTTNFTKWRDIITKLRTWNYQNKDSNNWRRRYCQLQGYFRKVSDHIWTLKIVAGSCLIIKICESTPKVCGIVCIDRCWVNPLFSAWYDRQYWCSRIYMLLVIMEKGYLSLDIDEVLPHKESMRLSELQGIWASVCRVFTVIFFPVFPILSCHFIFFLWSYICRLNVRTTYDLEVL